MTTAILLLAMAAIALYLLPPVLHTILRVLAFIAYCVISLVLFVFALGWQVWIDYAYKQRKQTHLLDVDAWEFTEDGYGIKLRKDYQDWCQENLKGRYGILKHREVVDEFIRIFLLDEEIYRERPDKVTLWFKSSSDYMYFKMTWH